MKHLLLWAGYSAYQAGCLAPFLWCLLLAGVASTLIPLLDGEEARR
jgi:putative hemolysin